MFVTKQMLVDLGLKSVMSQKSLAIILNDVALFPKTYEYKSLEEMQQASWFVSAAQVGAGVILFENPDLIDESTTIYRIRLYDIRNNRGSGYNEEDDERLAQYRASKKK